MGKKIRTLTAQESLVATFAKYSVSSRSTFHPDQWSSGAEPADMLIVVGRVLFFVNMIHSKKYFKELCDHNIIQARNRIIEWENGRQLRGKNELRSFSISWSDIDYIHVISVVDGKHCACIDHPVESLGLSPKVRLCTSLTSRVLSELAKHGGGARELIAIGRMMIGRGKTSELAGCRLVRKRYLALHNAFMAPVVRLPSRLGKALIGGRSVGAFDEFRFKFEMLRRVFDDRLEFYSDLAWQDIFPAVAFIVDSVAQMEWLDQGQIRSAKFATHITFRVVVSSNMQELALRLPEISKMADAEGSCFIYIISLTSIGSVESHAILKSPGRWATEADMRAIGSTI